MTGLWIALWAAGALLNAGIASDRQQQAGFALRIWDAGARKCLETDAAGNFALWNMIVGAAAQAVALGSAVAAGFCWGRL